MFEMPPTSRITELAATIAENTAIVDQYLTANSLPTPTFDVDGPPAVPIPHHETHVLAAQDAVIACTQELHNLMKGPTEMLMGIGVSFPTSTHLRACAPSDVATRRPSTPTMS